MQQAAIAAYRTLVRVARSDGSLSEEEERLLARYRRALGLRRRHVSRGTDDLAGLVRTPHEKAHVLKMIARIAWVDGRIDPRERRWLERVAAELGVPTVQYAEILVAVEHEHLSRSHASRASRGTWISLGAIFALVVAWVVGEPRREADEPAAAAPGAAARELSDAQLAELVADFEDLERRLLARVHQLEDAAGRPPVAEDGALRREVELLRERLDTLRPRSEAFQRISKELEPAVLLIGTEYVLRKQGRRPVRRRALGTGFFLTPDGHIVTNKHVVQPWKFQADVVRRLAGGWEIDPDSIRIGAWPADSPAVDGRGRPRFDLGYTTELGTLHLFASTPDRFEVRTEPTSEGEAWTGRFHSNDNSDLVLLQAVLDRPVACLELRPATSTVDKLDPVLVLGFPTGTGILEKGRAVVSPSLGEVRKVEDTIYVTAPIVGGNSGGPVVDGEGRVVGVATRRRGDATLGCCIKAEHVLVLLPDAEQLAERGARCLDRDERRQARRWLALAEERVRGRSVPPALEDLRRALASGN